jgi:hypothetical protein
MLVPGGLTWLNLSFPGVLSGAQTVCLSDWALAPPASAGGLADVVAAQFDMDGYGMCAWLRRADNRTLTYVVTEYPQACPVDFGNATTSPFAYSDGTYQASPLPTPSISPSALPTRQPTSGGAASGVWGAWAVVAAAAAATVASAV